MNKVWKIIKYEYTRHVLRRRFLLALISVPAWIIVAMGVSILAVFLSMNTTPLGYVDQSGLLKNPIQPVKESGPFATNVDILPFADEAAARKALEAKKIQAYFVLPPDFLQTRSARLIYAKEPDNGVKSDFNAFLRLNLLASQPKDIANRVSKGPTINVQATGDQRSMSNGDWFKTAAPIVGGIILLISVFTSGGYLMQAVVEEKENRTMEILATSVSPSQIMSGKIIGLIGVGLTQILVWMAFPLLAVVLAAAYIPTFKANVDWGSMGMMFLLIVPTFIMLAALMAAFGATVTEAREAQQATGFLSFPVMIPYMLMGVLTTHPGSPIALILSFFPLTSGLTMLIRMGFSSVPAWQTWLSVAILILSAIGSLWLAGRIFRMGMLRYGQRMRWKEIIASFRSAS